MSDWQDFKRETNRGARFGIGWIIAIIALVLLVVGAIWAINVLTSGVKGQGDAIAQNNSAENWVAKQAFFEETYAEIEATDRKLDIYAATLAADPTNLTHQQTLAGTKSYCEGLIGEYNAEARKFNSKDWRSPDLPSEIDTYNTATDCKENL